MTFHGVASPTGLERTFPNLLNSEAVMNLEYDKWNEGGVPPEHDVTVPLTRMLAGPLDYHQGTLRGVPLADFKPQVTSAAGDRHALPDAGLVRRVSESLADDGRLSVGLSRASADEGAGGDSGDLGRHAGSGGEGR